MFVRGLFSGLQVLPSTRCLTPRRSSTRFFSVSPYRAADLPRAHTEALKAFKNSPTFQKISQNPAALSAIQKLSEAMKNSGVELGTKPTTFQMLKLAANTEFREASKDLIREFQKAGVDLNSKDVLEELQSIAQAMGTAQKA